MNKIIKFYKDTLPLMILIFYSIGYTFLSIYYSHFRIDIEYYLSITDLLFFSIDLLLTLAIIGLVVEIGLILLTSVFYREKEIEETDKEKRQKIINERETNFEFLSLLILLIITVILSYFFDYDIYVWIIFFTLFPIKLINATKNDTSKEDKDISNVFLFTSLSIILLVISLIYGWREANKIKENNGTIFSKEIEFNYINSSYSTTDKGNLIFVGETSNNFFLYDRLKKKTMVFFKNELKNINISDPTILNEEEKKEIEEFKRKIEKIFPTEEKKKNE